jgi:hypothetical protein
MATAFPLTEDQLREATRKAILAQLAFHREQRDKLNGDHPDFEHHVVSIAQIESAGRILWML